MNRESVSAVPTPKKKLTVDGVTLAYEDMGDGRPVVFVHGFPTSTYSWRHLVGPLSGGYRVVTFDLMGYGESDKPLDEAYTIPRHAELIQAAMSQLGIESPVMVGHSMGGAICLTIARELRNKIAGMILVNPACYPQRIPWFFHALRIPIIPKLVLRRIPAWLAFYIVRGTAYHKQSKTCVEDIRPYVLSLQSEGAPEAFIATAKDIIPENIDELIASYRSLEFPVQVFWGKQDKVIPSKLGRRLAAEIPDCDFQEFDPCGHAPQDERPVEMLQMMKEFLGRVLGGAGKEIVVSGVLR